MRKILFAILALSIMFPMADLLAKRGGYSFSTHRSSSGSTRVHGYIKKRTGTYVYPHRRTLPDTSHYNNWSTKGNVNPYTGKKGSK